MRFFPAIPVDPWSPSTLDYSPKAHIQTHLGRTRARVDDAPSVRTSTHSYPGVALTYKQSSMQPENVVGDFRSVPVESKSFGVQPIHVLGDQSRTVHAGCDSSVRCFWLRISDGYPRYERSLIERGVELRPPRRRRFVMSTNITFWKTE